MLAMVIEKTRAFDKRIRVRNTTEYLATAVVVLVFARLAWKAPSAMEQTGLAIVAAGGVWIAFYILRFGTALKQPDPGANLTAYRKSLSENYDRQIRLLRNVKFWYLLPPYVGILMAVIGTWWSRAAHGMSFWNAPIAICLVTVVFALVWIANEVAGVRYIQRLKRELSCLEEDRD
jgi:hypothetical protein